MDGHGSTVHIHPSSAVWRTHASSHSISFLCVLFSFIHSANPTLLPVQLFGQESQLDWIIFHDVLATSRMFVRTVCPIRYEWVKDLLPKLHEVDVYELSSVAREEVTDEEVAKWESKEASKRQAGKQFMIIKWTWKILRFNLLKPAESLLSNFVWCIALCSTYLSCSYNASASTVLNWQGFGCTCTVSAESAEDALKKIEKRNDENSITEARARYMQRKQERQGKKVWG